MIDSLVVIATAIAKATRKPRVPRSTEPALF